MSLKRHQVFEGYRLRNSIPEATMTHEAVMTHRCTKCAQRMRWSGRWDPDLVNGEVLIQGDCECGWTHTGTYHHRCGWTKGRVLTLMGRVAAACFAAAATDRTE